MFTLIRIASVASILGLRWLVDPWSYFSLFVAVLFGHYVLAGWYGRRRVKPVVTGQISFLVLAGFIALVVLPPVLMLPPFLLLPPLALYVYFGSHHALTEGYMVVGRKAGSLDPAQTRLLISRVVLAFVGFCTIMIRDPRVTSVVEIPFVMAFGVLGLSFVAFVICLVPVAKSLERNALLDVIGFEVAGVATSCIVLFTEVHFFDAAFYHLFVWIYLPLYQLRDTKQRVKFVGQTAAVSAFFLVFTPLIGVFSALTYEFWVLQCFLWSYVHISSSFAFSGFNPKWIARLFTPRVAASSTA